MFEITSLSEMANGAVNERFNYELQKVVENICDPNTDPKKKRKITLTMVIEPDAKREQAHISIETKTTLCPAQPELTTIIIGVDKNGQQTARELKSGIKGQTFIDEENDISDDVGNKIVKFNEA